MIKAVIVDFYGVLYSNFNWQVVNDRVYADEAKSQQFAYYKTLSNRGKLSNIDFRKEVSRLANDKDNKDDPAVLPSPHINHELITLVRQHFPDSKLAILSNGNRPDVLSQLQECHIEEQFEAVITSSDMSFDKPEQAAFEVAFDKLTVSPEEALIIDDSPGHTKAARSYGYNVIRFIDNDTTAKEMKSYVNS